MGGSEGEWLGGLGKRQAIEPVLEDRIDVAVGADTDRQGAGTGGFQAQSAVAAAETE